MRLKLLTVGIGSYLANAGNIDCVGSRSCDRAGEMRLKDGTGQYENKKASLV
jgi:hypothetical protein